eukprot:gb/GFBE01022105.1/.p1 GENE.gb/GFBE01022105.1/~~gb/GFBE01022105.1/.p1  ORF type:complete len:169 (+),score=30.19 gb/GFBE01022105.1/:1-507(+)
MVDSSFLGGSWNDTQSTVIYLNIAMLSVVGCCLFFYLSDIYRLLPGWGPVRKFDSDGNEAQRAREELLAREYVAKAHPGASSNQPKYYGTIGKPTWGVLESPNQQEVSMQHPVYGQVTVRENFNATQQLRAESEWWAKDERHFMSERGLHTPELQINEPHLRDTLRMV